MEPSRSDSKGSPLRRQALESAMQTAADTMIAVTESFRDQYNRMDANAPRKPRPVYTHARTESGSSISSERLLQVPDDTGTRATSFDVSSTLSPRSPMFSHEAGPLQDTAGPLTAVRDSQSFLQPSNKSSKTQRESTGSRFTIRLATPNLPERLNTPRTPTPKRCSFPAPQRSEGYADPRASIANPFRHSYANGPTRPNSLLQAANPFRSSVHSYMVLRPDLGTESQRLGNVTHVRRASEGDALASKDFRRKPLAPGARRVAFNHGSNEVLFVMCICLAQVLFLAGFAQALISAKVIGASLKDERHQAWYTAAYTLTTGSFVFLGNRLGGIFGNKTIFVFGYIWLSVWSFLAGLAIYMPSNGIGYFCFCRAMQGIGPALLLSNGQALLRKAYPPGSRKTLIMGLFDASALVGLVLGAVMASLFTEWINYTEWSWSFYSMAVVGIALAALSGLVLPGKDVLVMHNLDGNMFIRINSVGTFLCIAGLALFCIGWNQAADLSFDNPSTYALMIVGVLVFAFYVFIESKATHPLVPFQQMRLSAGIILVCVAIVWSSFGVWAWYFVQFLQNLRGWTSLLTSAAFVPILFSGPVACYLDASLLRDRFKPHLVLLIATISLLGCSVLMATAPVQQTYWLNTFISVLIMPFGIVLANPSSVTLLNDNVPEGHQGLALSLVSLVTSYSLSLGLGIAGVVELYLKQDDNLGELSGIRAAQYFGLGLSGLGVILAFAFWLIDYFRCTRLAFV